jgi:hypothetical protein
MHIAIAPSAHFHQLELLAGLPVEYGSMELLTIFALLDLSHG